ncbi:uncharacterized protein LOC144525005 [Sander vitreus]
MMKFVFALVFLLHFCFSDNVNLTLNEEIIKRLDVLNDLYKQKKVNFTSPMVHMPKMAKHTHPSSCVSVFATKLKHLLDYVTVPKENETILQELKANLQFLVPHPQNDHKCQKVPINTSLPGRKPFQSYTNFLRSLNASKKR